MEGIYLLKTPGRTGSHIILSHFVNNNYQYEYTFEKDACTIFSSIDINTRTIIHDHSYDIPNESEKYHLLINKRRNLFDLGVSSALARISNNFGGAPAAKNFKTELHCDYLRERIHMAATKQHYYDLLIDKTYFNWKSVTEIYYEDFINDYDFVSQQLSKSKYNKDKMLTYPSLSHKDTITNYNALLKEFDITEINKINDLSKLAAQIKFNDYMDNN